MGTSVKKKGQGILRKNCPKRKKKKKSQGQIYMALQKFRWNEPGSSSLKRYTRDPEKETAMEGALQT